MHRWVGWMRFPLSPICACPCPAAHRVCPTTHTIRSAPCCLSLCLSVCLSVGPVLPNWLLLPSCLSAVSARFFAIHSHVHAIRLLVCGLLFLLTTVMLARVGPECLFGRISRADDPCAWVHGDLCRPVWKRYPSDEAHARALVGWMTGPVAAQGPYAHTRRPGRPLLSMSLTIGCCSCVPSVQRCLCLAGWTDGFTQSLPPGWFVWRVASVRGFALARRPHPRMWVGPMQDRSLTRRHTTHGGRRRCPVHVWLLTIGHSHP
mmetsp:Transcript_41883/g.104562  ORF Transcript_41883/g.104562 Transcript_41883/m.104562 type:complete len:261 (+) Transcript_41883:1369-2151(+)